MRIAYPLERPAGLSAVKDAEEFVKRFDEIFDEALLKRIAGSAVEDWDLSDTRGWMFHGGSIRLSSEMIYRVDYCGELCKKLLNEAIAKQKASLPEKFRDFKSPVHVIRSAESMIRIDLMPDDFYEIYRMLEWKGDNMKGDPSLIMYGELDVSGVGTSGVGGVFVFEEEKSRIEFEFDYLDKEEVVIRYSEGGESGTKFRSVKARVVPW